MWAQGPRREYQGPAVSLQARQALHGFQFGVVIGLILYGPSRPKSESLADMDLLMLFSDIVDFVSICLFVCTAV